MEQVRSISMIIAHIRSHFGAAFYPRLSEWAAAGVLFAMGVMLTLHSDLMATAIASGNGRGYHLLLEVAQQQTWASILVVFGFFRLVILLINGAWYKSPWGRAVTAFASCSFWTMLVLSFAPTAGFGFIMACGWLATDMINIMRAMRDARIVDDALRAREHGSNGLDVE